VIVSNFVVVDASVAVKWVVNVTDSDIARRLLTNWLKREMVILAPALIVYEVSNTLYKYVRAGQISYEHAERGLKEVIFPILEIDFSEETATNFHALELARRFELPATYDAHYLALAEYKSCELWTSDTRLWRKVGNELGWIHRLNEYHPS
jgi:predicted nucleic acid-binding protein